MVTYAQLQSESWWAREVRTPELKWLGDEMCRRTGRPRTAAGDKGDRFHLNGAHRSQEWILRSRFATNRAYTVQSGLTAEQLRHIAGFDFTAGTDQSMIAQCKRLMAALKAGKLEEVREFYGNVDGDRVVDGWDNLRNRAATSDSSHLWHWHLSIDRRKLRDKRLMERIVAITLGDPLSEEDGMAISKADVKTIWETDDVVAAPPSGLRQDPDNKYWAPASIIRSIRDAVWTRATAGWLAFWPNEGPNVAVGTAANRSAIYARRAAEDVAEVRGEVAALTGQIAGLTALVQQALAGGPSPLTPDQLAQLSTAVTDAARDAAVDALERTRLVVDDES